MKSRDPKKQITQLLKGVCVSTNIYTNNFKLVYLQGEGFSLMTSSKGNENGFQMPDV